ncbi:MAG: hypothetical protein BGO99_05820 [Nitrosospira sp. 56-18]|nr:MAG: hypothetical protein BGO99_05820 [Nitrosospira sp. 56-18]
MASRDIIKPMDHPKLRPSTKAATGCDALFYSPGGGRTGKIGAVVSGYRFILRYACISVLIA